MLINYSQQQRLQTFAEKIDLDLDTLPTAMAWFRGFICYIKGKAKQATTVQTVCQNMAPLRYYCICIVSARKFKTSEQEKTRHLESGTKWSIKKTWDRLPSITVHISFCDDGRSGLVHLHEPIKHRPAGLVEYSVAPFQLQYRRRSPRVCFTCFFSWNIMLRQGR